MGGGWKKQQSHSHHYKDKTFHISAKYDERRQKAAPSSNINQTPVYLPKMLWLARLLEQARVWAVDLEVWQRGGSHAEHFQNLGASECNCCKLMDTLGHDRCNMAPLCELKGIFLSWCSTTDPLCRQLPQVFLRLATPTFIVSKPQRIAGGRVKPKLPSQIPISNMQFVPAWDIRKMKLRNVITNMGET